MPGRSTCTASSSSSRTRGPPPRRRRTGCCGRHSRSGEGRPWPSSPTSPGRSPRSPGSRSFGSTRCRSASRPISPSARVPSSSPSSSCSSASTRSGSASAPSSCSPSTAREGRRTRSRRIAMRGARSWRRSASSRRSRSGSSSARILDQDPALDLVAAEPPAAECSRRRRPSLQSRSSSFVGRTRELREIRELLRRDDVRLLTLTGAAGSGKTRLALEVTGGLEGEPAGAVLVELARINDARLVARTIVGELGIQERPGQTAREALLEHLRDRQALLLLDNFEHVLAAAPLVRELLAGAPGVKVLVTSRAPLGIPEERVYRVPALELPDPSRRPSIARLRRTEAIRLFVDRARAARPDFELSETNAESVVELCVRLDGLPLALELAAARCNVLSPRALLERLDSRLDLLRAAPGSGVTERQWTLRGAIEWSYELLEPAEQQLFTSLASSSAGSRSTPPSPSRSSPTSTSWRAVESLLRNNLLATERARSDEPRLGMLETIREYALERLAARGDGEAVRRRHAELLPRAGRGGRAGPARPAAARVARASRRRARQHPRRAHVGGGCRRGGRRAQDRRGALALLAAAEPRARGTRAPAGAARARLRLARHAREGANHARLAGAQSRRPRDGPTDARGEPPGASPRGRCPHGRERARASRLGSSRCRGDRFRPCADPGGPRGCPWGSQSVRRVGVALASRRLSRGARGARRCRADDRGGRRPGTEARKCPERRWVEEVARGHRVDARRSRAGHAAVRREPRHPPEPGRRTGCHALSLTPRVSRARGG